MKPDEKKMQEKKIRLMKLALVAGAVYGTIIVLLLETIAEHVQSISMLLGIAHP